MSKNMLVKQSSLFYSIANSKIGKIYKNKSQKTVYIILAYHGVQDEQHPRCIRTIDFRDQMKYISENYNVLNLNDLREKIFSNADGLYMSITFDDGYKNIIKGALPILKKYNLPATIFLPVECIGTQNEWDKKRHEPLLEIMDQADIKNILKNYKNIFFGSHGMDHLILSKLSNSNIGHEVLRSKKNLEDRFDITVDTFSFPHGGYLEYDKRVINEVLKNGYNLAVSTRFGRYNTVDDMFQLKRLVIWPDDTLERLKMKLIGAYDWLEFKEKLAFWIKKILIKIK